MSGTYFCTPVNFTQTIKMRRLRRRLGQEHAATIAGWYAQMRDLAKQGSVMGEFTTDIESFVESYGGLVPSSDAVGYLDWFSENARIWNEFAECQLITVTGDVSNIDEVFRVKVRSYAETNRPIGGRDVTLRHESHVTRHSKPKPLTGAERMRRFRARKKELEGFKPETENALRGASHPLRHPLRNERHTIVATNPDSNVENVTKSDETSRVTPITYLLREEDSSLREEASQKNSDFDDNRFELAVSLLAEHVGGERTARQYLEQQRAIQGWTPTILHQAAEEIARQIEAGVRIYSPKNMFAAIARRLVASERAATVRPVASLTTATSEAERLGFDIYTETEASAEAGQA